MKLIAHGWELGIQKHNEWGDWGQSLGSETEEDVPLIK